MAEITCTLEEYNKFIGPRVRNRIQSVTKKRKKEINNICQGCGKKKELEAAHVRGKGRKDIIEGVLAKYVVDKDSGLVKADLKEVEDAIIKKHDPIDEYFKFLCSECHKKYDCKV